MQNTLKYRIRRLIEVDEWHPASEPPKPEDFEPTGKVDVAWLRLATQVTTSEYERSGYFIKLKAHWRRISPPK
jgi:hypothetical protein